MRFPVDMYQLFRIPVTTPRRIVLTPSNDVNPSSLFSFESYLSQIALDSTRND